MEVALGLKAHLASKSSAECRNLQGVRTRTQSVLMSTSCPYDLPQSEQLAIKYNTLL